jgi:heat shock protein HslJ
MLSFLRGAAGVLGLLVALGVGCRSRSGETAPPANGPAVSPQAGGAGDTTGAAAAESGAGVVSSAVPDTAKAPGAAVPPESGAPSAPGAAGPPESSATAATSPRLEGTTWRLIELQMQPVDVDATNQPATIRLNAETGTVTGSTGCNSLSGRYTLENSKLTFGSLISTLRACAKGMDIEKGMTDALASVDGYVMSGGTLALMAGGSTVARFEASESR